MAQLKEIDMGKNSSNKAYKSFTELEKKKPTQEKKAMPLE